MHPDLLAMLVAERHRDLMRDAKKRGRRRTPTGRPRSGAARLPHSLAVMWRAAFGAGSEAGPTSCPSASV